MGAAARQESVIAATNNASAPTINAYDEYGVPKAGNAGRFQYTGQIWLTELGLYHYKARLYSPYLGRFLQTDPVGYEGGINLYVYVADDPVNASDPSGNGQWVDDDGMTGMEVISMLGVSASRLPQGAPAQEPQSQSPTSAGTSAPRTGQGGGFAVPQVESMYAKRAAAGDPYARLAAQFGQDRPSNRLVAGSRNVMMDALRLKHGAFRLPALGSGPGTVVANRAQERAAMAEYQQIRVELAVAYLNAVRADTRAIPHMLNPGQIYDFHVPVFRAHGLSMTTFGGSPVTGTRVEAQLTSRVWCNECIGN